MSYRISDEEIALIKARYIKETGIVRPDIKAYVFGVAEAQRKASDEEWMRILDELASITVGLDSNHLHLDFYSWWQAQRKKIE